MTYEEFKIRYNEAQTPRDARERCFTIESEQAVDLIRELVAAGPDLNQLDELVAAITKVLERVPACGVQGCANDPPGDCPA